METTQPSDLYKSEKTETIRKRNASEPFAMPWEQGRPFCLSGAYIRTYYPGKEKLDDHPYWGYNKELIGDTLTMELRGENMYGKHLSLVISPQQLIVSCSCGTKTLHLCKHACSALMYKVKSDGRYFEQLYLPDIIQLNSEQRRLFHFELGYIWRRDRTCVPFKIHPEHGRVYRYINEGKGQDERYGERVSLEAPVMPVAREAKLVFGIPTDSSLFPEPVLLPYFTRTGTKTSQINPYSGFERSYLLTGEEPLSGLSVKERMLEAVCRDMLRLADLPAVLPGHNEGEAAAADQAGAGKQLLRQKWTELIPYLDEHIELTFFNAARSSRLSVKPPAGRPAVLQLNKASVRIEFDLVERESWLQLKLTLYINGAAVTDPSFLGTYYSCFIRGDGNVVHFIPDVQDEAILQQFRVCGFVLTVLEQDFSSFYENILLPLSGRYALRIHPLGGKKVFAVTELKKGNCRLVAQEKDDRLILRPVVTYPVGFSVNPMYESNLLLRNRGGRVHVLLRDKELEREFVSRLCKLHPSFETQRSQDYYWLPLSVIEKTTWLPDHLRELEQNGIEIDTSALDEGSRCFPYTFCWDLEISGERDGYYGVKPEFRFGPITVSPEQTKEMIGRSKNWFSLENGMAGAVFDADKQRLQPLFAVGRIQDGLIEIPACHFTMMFNYTDYITDTTLRADITNKQQMLLDLENMQRVKKPPLVHATLRPYQESGFGWLAFLREFGWGGILADDMGLGKTLQVICILEHHYQLCPDAAPSLIVVPNTLLFNWQEEFGKFAPHRKVHTHHGTDRFAGWKYDDSCAGNIVLTTYGTLVSDAAMLGATDFSYVILDESQSVKNRNSKRYEAAGQLKARYRIAMTGTPIENGIPDLYAQLSFVNPGFFGTFSDFKRSYKGIADGTATTGTKEELQRVISPFLMRRTKAQVATELPAKTEVILYCDMLSEQRKVYDEYRRSFRSRLEGSFEAGDAAHSKFLAIEGLMKLRQICNSPGLLKEGGFSHSSAKLDELMEQVSELYPQHKILIFSAFTSMLSLLKTRLHADGLRYAYLDGKTSGAERQNQVKLFQEDDDCRLFLLSLKAGGTGLNLTAADYVYLIDPWWNPAAEAQAIDRCYRIGQDKQVMAYRMICKDSIEEKILHMQAAKKALAESLILEDGHILKSLKKEDILRLFE